MAPLVRTGGSRHTGLAALPHRNIQRETGDIENRGSGNYASDEAKEIARLKRELRDTQDALDVLKKQSTFWENDRSHLSRSC